MPSPFLSPAPSLSQLTPEVLTPPHLPGCVHQPLQELQDTSLRGSDLSQHRKPNEERVGPLLNGNQGAVIEASLPEKTQVPEGWREREFGVQPELGWCLNLT